MRPASRMEALLVELCTVHGWCLEESDRDALMAARADDRDTIIDAILHAAFGPDHISDRRTRAWLEGLVAEWLFDPEGRGARSGLPD
ncbi:MAG: hypothetical protein AB7I08_03270 [Thermoleophilia bacterium]